MKKIKANEGYVFSLKDRSAVYGSILYLGKYDSEDNYIQLTEEEASVLKEEINKRMEAELSSLDEEVSE